LRNERWSIRRPIERFILFTHHGVSRNSRTSTGRRVLPYWTIREGSIGGRKVPETPTRLDLFEESRPLLRAKELRDDVREILLKKFANALRDLRK
jgi:hypothetical protein